MNSVAAHRKRIGLLSLALCGAVGIAAALVPPSFVLPAALLYLSLLIFFLLKHDWSIYLLLLASMCTAIYFDIGSITVRPAQLLVTTIAPAVFLLLLSGQWQLVRTNLDALILLYLFCNVFSSLLNSPDRVMSLQKCLLLTITFVSYFLAVQLIRSRKALISTVLLLIVSGVLEAIYGMLSVLLFRFGLNIGGAHHPYDDLYARGTFLEGNLFGSFQMMIALILISFLFNKKYAENRLLILFSLLLVLGAMVASYTRAAWLAFAFGVMLYVILFQSRLLRLYMHRIALIAVAFLLIGIASYAYIQSNRSGREGVLAHYLTRITKITDYRSRSASDRIRVWYGAFELWKKHPLFGNGTDAIKVLGKQTKLPRFGRDHWIPNSLLLALHDTGLIGLVVFLSIQVAFLWNLRRTLQQNITPFYRTVLEGFFVAFVCVQFTYLITNGFWLIFIWVFMGIGMACSRFALENAQTGDN